MKGFVCAVAGSVIVLTAAFCAARSAPPAPRRVAENPILAQRLVGAPVVSAPAAAPAAETKAAPRVEPVAAPAVEQAPTPCATAPSAAPQDGGQLMDWLLTAPEADFASLVATRELDQHVSAVIVWLSMRESEGGLVQREISDFMDRLNARVLACRK